MKKLLGRLILLGALAGGVVAARNYLKGSASGEEVVQLVFDDGSTSSLSSNAVEAQEFADIARKIVEVGI